MRTRISGRQAGWMALAALTLTGCTTWRVQHVAPIVLLTEARPGRVRIERSDASRIVLTQPAIAGDSIRGQQGAVAVADVRAIAIRRFDGLKTLGLVGGIFAAIGIGCLATDCMNYDLGTTFANVAPVGRLRPAAVDR